MSRIICTQPVGIWNAPRELGSDLVFVHNPFAKVRVRPGFFSFAEEYFVDDTGRLKRHDISTDAQ